MPHHVLRPPTVDVVHHRGLRCHLSCAREAPSCWCSLVFLRAFVSSSFGPASWLSSVLSFRVKITFSYP
ncbi:hypothetical protein K1719_041906 [Acacia pycnantha]|nr:hypothetical protein K1719_041906 [Acacia pycnantha]